MSIPFIGRQGRMIRHQSAFYPLDWMPETWSEVRNACAPRSWPRSQRRKHQPILEPVRAVAVAVVPLVSNPCAKIAPPIHSALFPGWETVEPQPVPAVEGNPRQRIGHHGAPILHRPGPQPHMPAIAGFRH